MKIFEQIVLCVVRYTRALLRSGLFIQADSGEHCQERSDLAQPAYISVVLTPYQLAHRFHFPSPWWVYLFLSSQQQYLRTARLGAERLTR